MAYITHGARRGLALGVWAVGLLLFALLSLWSVSSSRLEAENRLSGEAGRMAAQLAALLSLPAWELDELTARTIVMAAMEDESIYAVKVQTKRGMLEGQRRNYQWEPVPWDDEITADTVQGLNPLKMEGRTIGVVEVYLSPRANRESQSLMAYREFWHFMLAATFCSAVFLLLLWHWGELARLRRFWQQKLQGAEDASSGGAERIVLGLAAGDAVGDAGRNAAGNTSATAVAGPEHLAGDAIVSPALGRAFQRKNPEAWVVTAGLFRQTFGHAPELMSRLYADGEMAALCHLARMLEQAAPCLGAARLSEAARTMWAALNDPTCETRALAVEDCVYALEDVLVALEAAPR